MQQSDNRWIFDQCDHYGLGMCVAWRACVYVNAVRKNRDCQKLNALFINYPFTVDPVVVQCLVIATKLENQGWVENSREFDALMRHHKRSLVSTPNNTRTLRNLEFEVVESVGWKLMPTTPFVVLAEFDEPTLWRAASKFVADAAIRWVVTPYCTECVACAAIVAAECLQTQESSDTYRLVRALVACLAIARVDLLAEVLDLSTAMRFEFGGAKTASPERVAKRKKPETHSPISVVPENSNTSCHTLTTRCASYEASDQMQTPFSSSVRRRCN